MKRYIAILTVCILVFALAACGADVEPTAEIPTEAETKMHTLAPVDDEPEWAHVDSELALEDKDSIFAQGDDFLCFAVVGADDSAVLRFKLDEITSKMLKEQDADIEYYLTLDGKKIGDAELNTDFDEVTLVGDYTYYELCALATKIRGL